MKLNLVIFLMINGLKQLKMFVLNKMKLKLLCHAQQLQALNSMHTTPLAKKTKRVAQLLPEKTKAYQHQ